MPFIPHSQEDVRDMLDTIGASSIEDLFDEIPEELRAGGVPAIPAGITEMEIGRIMRERARQDGTPVCFAGAGAYDHHIPAAVWEIVTRGEFYTAYTPYQAEASQGTLQVLYEFQSMMAALTGLDVSNASLYEGGSALAEAILMAVRLNRKSKSRRVLVAGTVHPLYRRVADTVVRNQDIELVELPYDEASGTIDPQVLSTYEGEDITALVIPQPNFFGRLEEVDGLTDWGHANGALVIGVVNPMAMALLSPPGEWGAEGADMACGEGQPLGIPLSSGGPYFGFLCCKQKYVRQMPGRIAGRTVDAEGKEGFVLTLQAREQHIRRSKATSNICTNQGLMTTAATIYMSLMGAEGLRRVAQACHANTRRLVEKLTAIPGVSLAFEGPYFHEAVLKLKHPVEEILRALAAQNLVGGVALKGWYPELGETLMVCATETRSEADIDAFEGHLRRIIEKRNPVKCPIRPKI
jgi:glycine dehydrogenase subunit 1